MICFLFLSLSLITPRNLFIYAANNDDCILRVNGDPNYFGHFEGIFNRYIYFYTSWAKISTPYLRDNVPTEITVTGCIFKKDNNNPVDVLINTYTSDSPNPINSESATTDKNGYYQKTFSLSLLPGNYILNAFPKGFFLSDGIPFKLISLSASPDPGPDKGPDKGQVQDCANNDTICKFGKIIPYLGVLGALSGTISYLIKIKDHINKYHPKIRKLFLILLIVAIIVAIIAISKYINNN